MLTVLAECEDWWAIDKPAGVSVHRRGDEPGILDLLAQQTGASGWLVHRLDRVTSGVMLVARHAGAAAELAALFRQREIGKYYLALGARGSRRKRGWVIGDMERSRRGGWRLLHSHNRPACSYFFSRGLGDGRRLYLWRPYTGRTHQLRVAMKSMGCPIAGDQRYGGVPAERTGLHAWGLAFNWKDKPVRLLAPAPVFLADSDSLQEWSPPWEIPWPAAPRAS